MLRLGVWPLLILAIPEGPSKILYRLSERIYSASCFLLLVPILSLVRVKQVTIQVDEGLSELTDYFPNRVLLR